MAVKHGLRCLACAAVLLVILGPCATLGWAAERHHGVWASAPCCTPNAGAFGYFPTQWRVWPGEPRLDQDLPQAVGRTPVATPAPLGPTPEGRPGLPSELSVPPMPPGEPPSPAGPRAAGAKPEAGPAKPSPAPKPVAQSPQRSPAPDETKPGPNAVKPPEKPSTPAPEHPAAKQKGQAEVERLRKPASPAAPAVPPPQPLPVPKPASSPAAKSASEDAPLPWWSHDALPRASEPTWAPPASLAGQPPAERPPQARWPMPLVTQPAAGAMGPAEEAIRQATHLAADGEKENLRAGGRAMPALEGFCPVELVRNERWVPGDARYAAAMPRSIAAESTFWPVPPNSKSSWLTPSATSRPTRGPTR